MRILFLFVSVVSLHIGIAHSEPSKAPPSLEAYGALPAISSADVSPDGEKIAVIANIPGGSRLAVFKTNGELLVNVDTSAVKARSASFYGNDHVILDASETVNFRNYRGGKLEYSGAFAFSLTTRKFKQLLKGQKDLYPAQTGLGEIIGDGKKSERVLMPAYLGTTNPSKDLLSVDLNSGRGRRVSRGSNDMRQWFSDGDGNPIARVKYNNRTNKFIVEAFIDDKWENIYQEEREIPYSYYGLTPDLKGLGFIVTTNSEKGFDRLMKLGFDGKVTGPHFSSPGKEIDRVYTDRNRVIQGVLYSGNEPTYSFLSEPLQESYDSVMERLPFASLFLDSWSDDFGTILYNVYEPSLGDVWLLHKPGTNDLKLFKNNRKDIPADQTGSLTSIEYKSRDGLQIPAIVTTPNGTELGEAKNLPLIVLPHGGPASYDKMGFDWMAQYFASRGYAVLQPNFRGSTGFGLEFKEAGRGEWGGKMQDDITDGVNALAKAGMIDKSNTCIIGASYGGYAALAGAVFTPELYKCVVAIAPVSDLNLMLQKTKRRSGSDHWVISYWEGIMADGDARKKKLKAISPANFADNVKAPVLLLHGDDDTVVPIAQSRRMERALKKAEKEVTFVKLKGEDHWMSTPETRLQLLQEIDSFVAEHMPISTPTE